MTTDTAVPSLPVINIAPYHPATAAKYTDADRAAVADAFHLACKNVGFLYLRVDEVTDPAEMQQLLEYGREFFHLPQEEKEKIHLTGPNGDGARGYQRMHQNFTKGKTDHHEGLDLYQESPYPPVPAGERAKPLAGKNQLPASPAGMAPALEDWVAKMTTMGNAVMAAMADGLGSSEEEKAQLLKDCDKPFWSMRVIGYPPLPEGEDGQSCGEHKDYGCLTFLFADPCPASLQVLSCDNEWLNADMIPGCVVVNIGAMWERWTGGLYPATLHRVMHRSPTYRVSMPFFFEPNFDTMCKLLPAAVRRSQEEGHEIVDEGEIMYGDYLLGKVSSNFKY